MSQFDHESDDQSAACNKLVRDLRELGGVGPCHDCADFTPALDEVIRQGRKLEDFERDSIDRAFGAELWAMAGGSR